MSVATTKHLRAIGLLESDENDPGNKKVSLETILTNDATQYTTINELFCDMSIFRCRNQFFDEAVVEDRDEFTFALGIRHLALEDF